MDPVLRLYHECRVMIPYNKNVRKGQANGTQATFQRAVLKPGETPRIVKIGNNVPVQAVRASQIDHIVLRHCNDRIQPTEFSLEPKSYSFSAKLPKPAMLREKEGDRETLRMKAIQLPLVVNNATTGHKLQGSGVDIIFVHNWSYVTNWPYVILSRVWTQEGLFLRKKLSRDLSKYAVPDALKRMITRFKTRQPTYWTEDEYDTLFNN